MRELAEAKNQGENLVYTTERSLKEHRDSLDPEAVSTIESRLDEVRRALDGTDPAEIRAKTEQLMEASHKLAEAVYQRVQAQQAASTGAGAGTGPDGDGRAADEVVEEADYEVIDEEPTRE